jgi:hypothetical protein
MVFVDFHWSGVLPSDFNALYLKLNSNAMFITAGCTLFFAALAVTGFNPQKSGK